MAYMDNRLGTVHLQVYLITFLLTSAVYETTASRISGLVYISGVTVNTQQLTGYLQNIGQTKHFEVTIQFDKAIEPLYVRKNNFDSTVNTTGSVSKIVIRNPDGHNISNVLIRATYKQTIDAGWARIIQQKNGDTGVYTMSGCQGDDSIELNCEAPNVIQTQEAIYNPQMPPQNGWHCRAKRNSDENCELLQSSPSQFNTLCDNKPSCTINFSENQVFDDLQHNCNLNLTTVHIQYQCVPCSTTRPPFSDITTHSQKISSTFVGTHPNTASTQPNTDNMQPNTTSIQPNTDSTQPNTASIQPNTDSTQPNTISIQPNTANPQPNTVSTQSNTANPQPNTVSIQSNTANPQPNTVSIQSNTASIQPNTDDFQSNTEVTGPIITETTQVFVLTEPNKLSTASSTGAIIGGIVGGIAMVTVVLVVLIVMYRRNRKDGRSKANSSSDDQNLKLYSNDLYSASPQFQDTSTGGTGDTSDYNEHQCDRDVQDLNKHHRNVSKLYAKPDKLKKSSIDDLYSKPNKPKKTEFKSEVCIQRNENHDGQYTEVTIEHHDDDDDGEMVDNDLYNKY